MAKQQNVKLKKSAWIGICITLAALVLFIILLIPTEKEKISKAFEGNSDFPEDHIIDQISYSKFKKLLEKSGDEKIYVLVGTAEQFTESIDVFDEVAKDNGVKKLYWLTTTDSHIDEDDEIKEFCSYLRSNIGTDSNNNSLIKKSYLVKLYFGQQKDMFVFQNGKIVNRYYDVEKATTDSEGQAKSTEYLLKNHLFK